MIWQDNGSGCESLKNIRFSQNIGPDIKKD
jgi:hypothetical protein